MKQIVFTIFLYLISWCCLALWKYQYQFTYFDVKDKVALAIGTDQYDLMEQSNNSVWVGSPDDITYVLKLKETDEYVSCKCTAGMFQPIICRKYE